VLVNSFPGWFWAETVCKRLYNCVFSSPIVQALSGAGMTAKRQTKKETTKATKKKSKPTKAKVAKKTVRKKKSEPKKQRFDVEFYRDWCKGCGICAAFCPAEALSMSEKGEPQITKPELCTGCTWCEIRCPDFAVRVQEKKEEKVCEA
jgi:2-oxoglutarate ferredoxin oxidoreductase subunit delta